MFATPILIFLSFIFVYIFADAFNTVASESSVLKPTVGFVISLFGIVTQIQFISS